MQTRRELFQRIMSYEKPERMLIWSWGFGFYDAGNWDGYWPGPGTHFWQNTVDRWREQDLPAEIQDRTSINDYFGVDRRLHIIWRSLLWPFKGTEILEDTGGFQIMRDDSGRVMKGFSGSMSEMSMPHYVSHPLTSREDWKRFAAERLDPDTPGREVFRVIRDGHTLIESAPGADNFEEARTLLRNSDLPVEAFAGSLYGYLREWMGLVNLSYALYDDEDWIREMMDHLADLTLAMIEKVLAPLDVPIDNVQWWEDMAYNNGPLISPDHVRRLMVPNWRRVNDAMGRFGARVISIDSDGNNEKLIPIWLDSGINCVFPNEVAAGSDVVALRREFGRDLLLMGGIDKRALAQGEEAIREELDRRLPLIAEGGYIPEVDHAVPPDVSFENYCIYKKLLVSECARYLQ